MPTINLSFPDQSYSTSNKPSITTLKTDLSLIQTTLNALDNENIAAGAAIAYSKLALTAGIVNADINAAAAIAMTKLAGYVAPIAYTPTVVGFSSTSEKVFLYSVVGKILTIWYQLGGTSNASETSFTIPSGLNIDATAGLFPDQFCRMSDNGTFLSGPGMVEFGANTSNKVLAYKDCLGNPSTPSGTKSIQGKVVIPIA